MPKIERFEQLVVWQKARTLNREIYRASRSARFNADVDFRRQIRRATMSIAFNIAEGFERGGLAEFAQFLSVAKGSAGEVQSQLYLALDEGYIEQADFDRLYADAVEIGRMLAGLRRSVRDQLGTKVARR